MKKRIVLLALIVSQSFFGNTQSPGNSLDFDGINDNVSATLPTVFSNIAANDLTVETWVKPNAAAFQRVLFAQFDANNFVTMSLGSGNTVFFYVNNLSIANESVTTLAGGQWSHVACTWNANTQEVQIYINGVLDALITGGSSSTGTNNIMTIGSRTDGNQYFTGELDELRIWNDLRTECEINGGMNSEYTVAQPNLVAYYNFNEGVASGSNAGITSLPDFTTNYNGTLQNFALTGVTSNWVSSAANITQLNQTSGSFSTDMQVSCDTYDWIDGNTYTSSNNIATYTYINGAANGCDSTVTLDLILNNSTSSSITDTGIDVYAAPSGATYMSSGIYNDTILNAAGCDSVITIDLTMSYTGTDELWTSLISIYPNPASSKITLKGLESIVNIKETKIVDLSGMLVYESSDVKGNINVSELDAGIYILIIHHSKGVEKIRFVKG